MYFEYLLACQGCPGLETIAEQFPERHSERPDIRGTREPKIINYVTRIGSKLKIN